MDPTARRFRPRLGVTEGRRQPCPCCGTIGLVRGAALPERGVSGCLCHGKRFGMVQALEIRTGGKRARDTRVIGLVSGAHFVSHFYILLLPPLFPFVRAEYGALYIDTVVALAPFHV